MDFVVVVSHTINQSRVEGDETDDHDPRFAVNHKLSVHNEFTIMAQTIELLNT